MAPDACLLMSILGWIALGFCFVIGVYLWYMTGIFLLLLRAASANTRRVQAAIDALPVARHSKAAASSDDDGAEPM
eukprot:3488354-Prymnesium_polylepis.1